MSEPPLKKKRTLLDFFRKKQPKSDNGMYNFVSYEYTFCTFQFLFQRLYIFFFSRSYFPCNWQNGTHKSNGSEIESLECEDNL